MKVKDRDNKGIFVPYETYVQLMLLEQKRSGCVHLYLSLKYFAGIGRDYPFDAKCPGKLKQLVEGGLITMKAREIVINSVEEAPEGKKINYRFKNLPGVVNKDGVRELQKYYSQKLQEYMGVMPESNLMYRYVKKLDFILSMVTESGEKLFTLDEIKTGIDYMLKIRKVAHLNFLQDHLMDTKVRRNNTVYDRAGQEQRKVYNMVGQLVELMAQRGCGPSELIGAVKVYDLKVRKFREVTSKDVTELQTGLGGPVGAADILQQVLANGKPWQSVLMAYKIIYEEVICPGK